MNLDNVTAVREMDPDNMLDRIAELPQQCRDAWLAAQELDVPGDHGDIEQVVVLGMGGSAIGGALLKGLVEDDCTVPISVVRGYELPAFVEGADTLVVASSYSGNTEETLSSFRKALERGAKATAITTGGKLGDLAAEHDLPIVTFEYDAQPRAALGFSFTLLLGLFTHLGLVRDFSDDVEEAAAVMEAWQEEIALAVPTEENEAKQLARSLAGRLPVVYGAGFLTAAANRWKTQFNENAKHWAFFEQLPELNHNAVVGFGLPEVVRENAVVLMLRSNHDHPRVQVRWDVTEELLEREGVDVETVEGRGESALAQMLSVIHFGDYVSYYLTMLNGVDPTPVETIAFLKRRLANGGR